MRFYEKRGLSNLIAYVLLISISISLSVVVYNWLGSYVPDFDNLPVCSDNVELMIASYTCVSGADGFLKVNLLNRGLFGIDGFMLKVHDTPDAEFAFYPFDDEGVPIDVGGSVDRVYNFNDSNINTAGLFELTLLEVRPYLLEDGKVSCQSYAFQKLFCSLTGAHCIPNCFGKCGGVSDGCAGTCGAVCGGCVPDCVGKCGGESDGCAGTCGAVCGGCVPDCVGKCGGESDGCAGTCDAVCGGGGGCTPDCTDKCGGVSDGCAGTCDAVCGGCTPDCTDKCGGVSDGCAGTCGAVCVDLCFPDCTGKCGGESDGCEGTCDAVCCIPDCVGKCGGESDGCAGTCDDACPLVCPPGWADCDSDGLSCEVQLGTSNDCSVCGNTCGANQFCNLVYVCEDFPSCTIGNNVINFGGTGEDMGYYVTRFDASEIIVGTKMGNGVATVILDNNFNIVSSVSSPMSPSYGYHPFSPITLGAADGSVYIGAYTTIIKRSHAGYSQWAQEVAMPLGSSFYTVMQADDEDYVIGAATPMDANSDASIIKLDSMWFSYNWAKSFDIAARDRIDFIGQTSDDGYIVSIDASGLGCAPNCGNYLLKLDSSGDVDWSRKIGGSDSDNVEMYKLVQVSDGGYVGVGNIFIRGATNYYALFIAKFDSLGNIEWSKKIGTAEQSHAYDFDIASDGGYLLTGTSSFLGVAGNYDLILMKFGSSGNYQWGKIIGGAGRDSGLSVEQSGADEILVVGETKSYGDNGDVLLIRFDSQGDVEDCDIVDSINPVVSDTGISSVSEFIVANDVVYGTSSGYVPSSDVSLSYDMNACCL